jgi:hypothetical protein
VKVADCEGINLSLENAPQTSLRGPLILFTSFTSIDFFAPFGERRKIHDLLMEGVELALKKRGYPTLADLKAKWQLKER